MKLAELSLATAFASNVFPVPGAIQKYPLGGRILIFSNYPGIKEAIQQLNISCFARQVSNVIHLTFGVLDHDFPHWTAQLPLCILKSSGTCILSVFHEVRSHQVLTSGGISAVLSLLLPCKR